MIEVLEGFPDNVVAVSCRGHVTRSEYETVLEPVVETALAGHEQIRLYYEVGEDFEGVGPEAVWEDIKIGVEHRSRWERIAVVTDVEWIRRTMGFFGFLIPGEIQVFPAADADRARAWIVES